MTQALKSITLELPEEDWAALEREADILGLSVEQVVNLKFRRLLKAPPKRVLSRQQVEAQAELFLEASKVFQQAAEALGLREEDIVPMVRRARRVLAEEGRRSDPS